MASALSDLRRIPHLQEATSVAGRNPLCRAPHYQRCYKPLNTRNGLSMEIFYWREETIYTRPKYCSSGFSFLDRVKEASNSTLSLSILIIYVAPRLYAPCKCNINEIQVCFRLGIFITLVQGAYPQGLC